MTNTAHTGHNGGIQRHSCGEIAPWTIVLVGCGFAKQHVYALNGETGETLTSWHYSDYGKVLGQHDRSFRQAHRQATRQAAGRLAYYVHANALQFA
jgi:hypothetical protein